MARVPLMDMNDRGDIVGSASTPEGYYHGFLCSRGRQTIKLGTPFAAGNAIGYDINDSGLVVGRSYNNENWTEFVTLWYTGR